jgi:hypothetical protein
MKFEEFKNYIELNNLNYELKSYNKEKGKYQIVHLDCGHEYEVTATHFVTKGRRCPKCNGGVKYTHNDFVEKVKKLVGNEYSVIGKYINASTRIKMKHNLCGHEYEVRPANFLSNGEGLSNRCPACFKNHKKSTSIFKDEVYNLVKTDYSVVGDYVNNKTKIKMKHNLCGHEYEVIPKDFLKRNGNRCPLCAKSKGEEQISTWLKNKNLRFVNGYKIDDCKNIFPLEFDFQVDIENSFILIEFDGRLHFEPWQKGKKHLEHLQRQQENDKIKDDYCRKNNISLFRINYLDDIEKELNKIFSTSTTIESTSKDGSK